MSFPAGFRVGAAGLALLGASAAFVFRPAVAEGVSRFAKVLASVNCKNTTACQQYENISTGAGVTGISTRGSGIIASTYYSSTAPTNGQSGLLGEDDSSSGPYDVGVTGTSTNGQGVVGWTQANNKSLSAVNAGVSGSSTSSENGVGVYGTATSGAAVFGNSTGDASGVLGWSSGASGNALVGLNSSSSAATILLDNKSGGPVFEATNPGGQKAVMTVDSQGDVNIQGEFEQRGQCVAGCSSPRNDSPGSAVVSYSSQSTQPTIEDFGEAQLTGGFARVRLDPAFANAIAQRTDYLVFITPEGDNRGLYVTGKSLAGFDVRESQDGRSTLAFSYRIVARPYGVEAPRLPMAAAPSGNR
jgi:hypothetical protein